VYQTELNLDGYVADVPDDIPAVADVLVAEDRIEQQKSEDRDFPDVVNICDIVVHLLR